MRIKKNEGFLKKWLILGNVGHIQGEPGVFYNTIKYMLNKKQTPSDGNMSNVHRSQLKEFLMVKARNLSNKISTVV